MNLCLLSLVDTFELFLQASLLQFISLVLEVLTVLLLKFIAHESGQHLKLLSVWPFNAIFTDILSGVTILNLDRWVNLFLCSGVG